MYQQYFGFTKEPFAADVPIEQLYQSASFKELRTRLDHVMQHRGIMLVTGESGAGKTTALRSLLWSLNTKLFFPVYLPLATVGVSDFYRQLNRALGGDDHFFKSVVHRSIQELLTNHAQTKNCMPVIVFDEAHLLKEQNFRELQIIANFRMDTFLPAVFIIAGQPLLSKRLAMQSLESFAQRITLAYHLGAMSEDETIGYIRHHLAIAGGTDRIIDDKTCIIVHQKSKGMPRPAGTLMKKAFIAAMSKGAKSVDTDDVLLAAKELR
jgi:type II secretory pathway predicted ATPase ExeA